MTHHHAFEALERTLRDLCDDDRLFGGKLVVFGGDFRQVLPVVTKGSRQDIVAASLCRAIFWSKCHVMQLKTNMRLMDPNLDPVSHKCLSQFSSWILEVGNGTVRGKSLLGGNESNWIEIPQEFLVENGINGLDNLINFVYPNLSLRYIDDSYLQERCILAPTNNDVDELNLKLLKSLPGISQTYLSSDTFRHSSDDAHNEDIHPPEVLHELNFSGFPSHKLELTVGAPVVLLRNLDPAIGLCNGTRLIIEKLGNKVIEAKVLTGRNIGDTVVISRMDLTPSTKDLPFFFKRRQFPLKLAFAMTINKSQGQTLKSVGIYLPKPIFSHGQLYVAISRVTSPSGLKFLICNKSDIPRNVTKNVVFREVFNEI